MYIRNFSSALVAQLDRATGYEPVGRAFESLQARHKFQGLMIFISPFFVPANGYDLFEHDFFYFFWGLVCFYMNCQAKCECGYSNKMAEALRNKQSILSEFANGRNYSLP